MCSCCRHRLAPTMQFHFWLLFTWKFPIRSNRHNHGNRILFHINAERVNKFSKNIFICIEITGFFFKLNNISSIPILYSMFINVLVFGKTHKNFHCVCVCVFEQTQNRKQLNLLLTPFGLSSLWSQRNEFFFVLPMFCFGQPMKWLLGMNFPQTKGKKILNGFNLWPEHTNHIRFCFSSKKIGLNWSWVCVVPASFSIHTRADTDTNA